MAGAMNVLFITTDQQRFDALGFMGHPDVQTPHLDRLAARSTVFERVYVTNPVCMPSRASLLLGQFPDAHGVRRNGIEVPDKPWGLAKTLRAHGYRTGMFGKTHFCPLRRDYRSDSIFHDWRSGEEYYGFEERSITHDLKDFISDVSTAYHGATPKPEQMFAQDDYIDWIRSAHLDLYTLAVREGLPGGAQEAARELWTSDLPVELHQSTWITDQTMAFIERQRATPFFAWCSFVDPHHPFNAPRAYRGLYDPAGLTGPIWQEGELEQRSRYHRDRHTSESAPWTLHWREYRAQYYGMISLIDAQVARLVRHLEDLGVAEHTAIVFTSDHGEMLGDHGLARKGLFHYEPLIRVPLLVCMPSGPSTGQRHRGIVQSVDITATILDFADVPLPEQHQGRSLLPWCRDGHDDAPREHALVSNGGEGPNYNPWPELRTLVTDRWKLQYYVNEGRVELDDLATDPDELHPLDPEQHQPLVHDLMGRLVDASSAASTWGSHIGRW
ncbi:MAG: sulfatase-like hydrolase/transferase [Chloroflexia bacterium]|nr:sulfatase-like hydrolase/transferase [Chloroflexia bacterium]